MTVQLHLTNAWQLRALSHPLRLRILGSLRVDGPATAAILARRLETDSGQTSFHVRHLAKHQLVTEAPELGAGRERYWRATSDSTVWDSTTISDERDRAALRDFEQAATEVWYSELTRYRRTRDQWPLAWQRAVGSGDFPLHTTPEGLAALMDELVEVVARYDQGPDAPGTELVSVLLHGFPTTRPAR